MVRHRNLQTTQRYIDVTSDMKRAAVELVWSAHSCIKNPITKKIQPIPFKHRHKFDLKVIAPPQPLPNPNCWDIPTQLAPIKGSHSDNECNSIKRSKLLII